MWSVRAEKRRAGVEGADLVNTLAFRVGSPRLSRTLPQNTCADARHLPTQLDNLTMLEANHFRRIAQLALDFNLDAKMAFEGEVSPPELESLNRRVRVAIRRFASHTLVLIVFPSQRGNLAELLGLGNIPRLSQSDLYSGEGVASSHNAEASLTRCSLFTRSTLLPIHLRRQRPERDVGRHEPAERRHR